MTPHRSEATDSTLTAQSLEVWRQVNSTHCSVSNQTLIDTAYLFASCYSNAVHEQIIAWVQTASVTVILRCDFAPWVKGPQDLEITKMFSGSFELDLVLPTLMRHSKRFWDNLIIIIINNQRGWGPIIECPEGGGFQLVTYDTELKILARMAPCRPITFLWQCKIHKCNRRNRRGTW